MADHRRVDRVPVSVFLVPNWVRKKIFRTLGKFFKSAFREKFENFQDLLKIFDFFGFPKDSEDFLIVCRFFLLLRLCF